jgi:hypothetical protein
MGRHNITQPPPVITAGEAIRHTWCPICQEPWRVRIPLLVNGEPCGGIEVCPGCGSVHDKPGVYITPPAPDTPGAPLTAPGATTPLLPRLACTLHSRRCRRKGLRSPGCALGDCPWPGLWRHAVPFDEDDGVTTYLFCRKRHKRAWAAVNDMAG